MTYDAAILGSPRLNTVDFFRSVYDDNRDRPRHLRRRPAIDLALHAVNSALAPFERRLVRRRRDARWPIAFVIVPIICTAWAATHLPAFLRDGIVPPAAQTAPAFHVFPT